MLTMFERFLMVITRMFPPHHPTGTAGSRREFLGSALRVGVGLATLQLGAALRPRELKAGSACECCYGFDCCETPWFECEPANTCPETGASCWTSWECELTNCCDFICPGEGYCINATTYPDDLQAP